MNGKYRYVILIATAKCVIILRESKNFGRAINYKRLNQ